MIVLALPFALEEDAKLGVQLEAVPIQPRLVDADVAAEAADAVLFVYVRKRRDDEAFAVVVRDDHIDAIDEDSVLCKDCERDLRARFDRPERGLALHGVFVVTNLHITCSFSPSCGRV